MCHEFVCVSFCVDAVCMRTCRYLYALRRVDKLRTTSEVMPSLFAELRVEIVLLTLSDLPVQIVKTAERKWRRILHPGVVTLLNIYPQRQGATFFIHGTELPVETRCTFPVS